MIPLQALTLEKAEYHECEDRERHDFLDHLELDEIEWASIAREAYPIGRDLGAIFEERESPREEYDHEYRPTFRNLHLLKLEVSVPREGHEDIRS